MLKNINGDDVSGVPHLPDFNALKRRLGDDRLHEVRASLHCIIDGMRPDAQTGRRTFSSSFLGSKLSPWAYPIAHLYDVAGEIEGRSAEERDIQERAGLIFGLFVWECIVKREEQWVFYDPNLSGRDPNREITGKVYFEQGN